ncbi:MAG: hypothetical protein WBE37_32850 [Bryobacteraceae bacterium]
MSKRKTSQVAFIYAVVTAVVATCIILFGLTADWSRFQTALLLVGSLVVVWAIAFSFMEVARLAARSEKITGPDERVDPDAPCVVIVEPPTGEATPHHESHVGSPGLDQGQLTSSLPDHTPTFGKFLSRGRRREHGT